MSRHHTRRSPCTTALATTKHSPAPRSPKASRTSTPTSWAPALRGSWPPASWCVTPRCPARISTSSRRVGCPAAPATASSSPLVSPCAAAARWTTTSRSCGTSIAPSPPSSTKAKASLTSTTGSTRRTPTTRCAAQPRAAARTPTWIRSLASPTPASRRS